MSDGGTLYFAYGSNMSRARLQQRVGPVEDLGWSTLAGYRHAFNKRGADGSAKGNIVIDREDHVHGVLYRLTHAQLAVLSGYEGGYGLRDLEVQRQRECVVHVCTTYVAHAPVDGLWPRSEYLHHYAVGMFEHGLPHAYIARLLAEFGVALPESR